MEMLHKCLMDPIECNDQLGSNDVKLVDCRFMLADTEWGRREYEASHIPGAVYAHMDDDLSGRVTPGVTGRHPLPEQKDFIRKLETWGISNKDSIVVYDQSHGGLAARLWWMLRWIGHDKVSVLDGGWAEWCKQGLPVTSDIPAISRSSFEGRIQSDMAISRHEVSEWTNDDSLTIIDARAHERYTGAHEPIDPVAGHIPGACSMPFLDNINDKGRWKTPEELRRRFSDLIADHPERAVVYCGSGVTACHNILALEVAGFKGVRLYPGSWSEWITTVP